MRISDWSSDVCSSDLEIVQQGVSFGVQPDVPDPALVGDLLHRLNGDANVVEVRDPALQHAAERVQPGAGEVQVQHGVVADVEAPVERRVVLVQPVELHRAQRALCPGDEAPYAAAAAGARKSGVEEKSWLVDVRPD